MATKGAGRYQYNSGTGISSLSSGLGPFGGNVLNNSHIVCGVKWMDVDSIAAIVDTTGVNTYQSLGKFKHTTVDEWVELFVVPNCVGHTDMNLTVNFSTPVNNVAIHWREYRGLAADGAFVAIAAGIADPAATSVVTSPAFEATGAGVIFAMGAHNGSGNFVTDPESETIYILGSGSASQDRLITTAGSYTTGMSHASARNMVVVAALFQDVAPVDTTPTLDDAEDEAFFNGETDISLVWTNGGATQGTGRVVISPANNINDAGAVAQTVTAWSDTAGTITAVRGSLPFLTDVYLFMENDAGESNANGLVVQFQPRVYIREKAIKLNKAAFANQSGLTALVWRSEPGAAKPNPDQAIGSLTIDAEGDTNWEIERGTLTSSADPVWVMAIVDASPQIISAMRCTTVWE